MLWKEIAEGQLFVYWNGELIFKRWLKGHGFGGHNVVFGRYGPPVFYWDQNLDREREWEPIRVERLQEAAVRGGDNEMEQITLTGWFVLYEIGDELRLVAGCTENEAGDLVKSIEAGHGEVKAMLPYDPFVDALLASLADE